MNSVKIIYSKLFQKYPELLFGFSTKPGGVSSGTYGLNMSNSTADNNVNVEINRKLFFDELGIKSGEVTFQKQIHSANINYSCRPQHFEDSDALFTDKKNNFLAISVADCIPVFLYEPQKKVVAGIHCGWKGTSAKILILTIEKLIEKFSIDSSEIVAYIGPGISKENYEVSEDVAKLFTEDVKEKINGKYLLDLKAENHRQLISAGVKKENIEVSELCTFKEKELLHSYRRDKERSGRSFGIIGIRK